jgi:uncharacterized membrane protein
VLAFTDAVYAIAMTLLVIGITVPTIDDSGSVAELWDSLGDEESALVSFFVSFAVIGRYWAAHHEFIGRMSAMDRGMIAINLVYLAFIAFLPFPTDLLGTYFENPLSVTLYATNVAIVSGLEVVLFSRAHRRGLLTEAMPEPVYRWGVLQSSAPVFFFLISIPVAFASTGLAVATWFGTVPFAVLSRWWQPPAVDRHFG